MVGRDLHIQLSLYLFLMFDTNCPKDDLISSRNLKIMIIEFTYLLAARMKIVDR